MRVKTGESGLPKKVLARYWDEKNIIRRITLTVGGRLGWRRGGRGESGEGGKKWKGGGKGDEGRMSWMADETSLEDPLSKRQLVTLHSLAGCCWLNHRCTRRTH
jgi:hypothetical protein